MNESEIKECMKKRGVSHCRKCCRYDFGQGGRYSNAKCTWNRHRNDEYEKLQELSKSRRNGRKAVSLFKTAYRDPSSQEEVINACDMIGSISTRDVLFGLYKELEEGYKVPKYVVAMIVEAYSRFSELELAIGLEELDSATDIILRKGVDVGRIVNCEKTYDYNNGISGTPYQRLDEGEFITVRDFARLYRRESR